MYNVRRLLMQTEDRNAAVYFKRNPGLVKTAREFE